MGIGKKGYIMLKSEKFFMNYVALKDENTMDIIRSYVISIIRHAELEKAQRKISKDREAIQTVKPGLDALTCDLAVAIEVLGQENAGTFIKDRAEYLALVEECNNCISLDGLTAYPESDVARLKIMAHMIYPAVNLENVLENVDLATPIKTWYSKGQGQGKLKDLLAPVFTKLLSTEGELFYGIRVKRSQFDDEDIRHFISIFGGTAKRAETKTKDKDGKETVKFTNYNWVDKSGNKKLQYSALTTLLAVILDNPSKHVVIKPDEKSASEATK